jgi:hypothetical protein
MADHCIPLTLPVFLQILRSTVLEIQAVMYWQLYLPCILTLIRSPGVLFWMNVFFLTKTLQARGAYSTLSCSPCLLVAVTLCLCKQKVPSSQVKAGVENQRKRMLKTIPVVGVTCCSSALPILDGLVFDICILDECSQIVEPLALLPMVRSKCK